MPCYRCGAMQTDPAKGASPWKRGVRSGVQVLVCPTCQRRGDWMPDLDRCSECGSTMLVRILGDTCCRACGASQADSSVGETGRPVSAAGSSAPACSASAGGLADEVEAALDRFFGRA